MIKRRPQQHRQYAAQLIARITAGFGLHWILLILVLGCEPLLCHVVSLSNGSETLFIPRSVTVAQVQTSSTEHAPPGTKNSQSNRPPSFGCAVHTHIALSVLGVTSFILLLRRSHLKDVRSALAIPCKNPLRRPPIQATS